MLLHPPVSVIILNHKGVDTSVAFQNASSCGGYCTPQKGDERTRLVKKKFSWRFVARKTVKVYE